MSRLVVGGEVVEGREGQARQVEAPVVPAILGGLQQGGHTLPRPHGDQDGVLVFPQLGDEVTPALRSSVWFVGLEGLSRLLLHPEPSTPDVLLPCPPPPPLLPLKLRVIKSRPGRRPR